MLIKAEDIAAFCVHVGATDAERAELLELRSSVDDPLWIAPGVNSQLAAIMEFERGASKITEIQPFLITGLLQTEAYMRAVMAAYGVTPGEIETRTMVRLGRQNLINRGTPLVAVVGEAALRWSPGAPTEHLEQLRHVQLSIQRPNVRFQVLRLDTPHAVMMGGPVLLLDFDKDRPTLHLEGYYTSSTVMDGKTIEHYRVGIEDLLKMAMSPADSAGLIANVITELERTTP